MKRITVCPGASNEPRAAAALWSTDAKWITRARMKCHRAWTNGLWNWYAPRAENEHAAEANAQLDDVLSI